MNIGDTLKFFRTKKHITQKELLPTHIDPSSYSRIEGNRRPIRLNDLQSILRNLEIHPDEFFSYVSMDEDQDYYRKAYYYCSAHPTNQKEKKKFLQYYENLKQKKHKDLRELSNYIGVKSLFHLKWEEVESITPDEVDFVYKLLLNKDYYFQYDYILLNNLITFFDTKQTDLLLMKAFPIKDEQSRDYTTKKFAYTTWLNAISMSLYREDYEKAEKYIKLAGKQNQDKTNYNFRMNLRYLDHLTNYLKNGEPEYMQQINNFIHILEDIGDKEFAQNVRDEVKLLTHNKGKNDIDRNKYGVTSVREN